MPAPGGFIQPNWWGGVPLPQYQPARPPPAAPAVDPNQLALQQAQANMLRQPTQTTGQLASLGAGSGVGFAPSAGATGQLPPGMGWQQFFKSIGWGT